MKALGKLIMKCNIRWQSLNKILNGITGSTLSSHFEMGGLVNFSRIKLSRKANK